MKVLLSVGCEGAPPWRDLELAAERPLQELLPHLVNLFAEQTKRDEWELWAGPHTRRLNLAQSLAGAGVWSGSWLLLRPTTPEE